MVKSRSISKLMLTMACAAVMMVGSATMCFAASDTTPAHINVSATSIDFEITEKINMTGQANSTDLTVDSLAVTNNSEVGVINIDNVAVNAVTGWEKMAMDTEWEKLAADANKFGLQADGSFDMMSDYTAAGEVQPGATDTTAFTGKTGMVTADLSDVKVADVVVTVSYK